MDRRDNDSLRKHGAKALRALPERQVTTSLTSESDGRVYHWVTERCGCRLSRR